MVRLGAQARAVARQPWPFNGIFWLLVFLGLVAKDFYTITDIEGASGIEIASLVAGRLVTNASLTLALVLAVQALLGLAPKVLRWTVFAVASLIPVIVLASFAVRQAWNKSLVEVLNDFTVSGRFNLTQELDASGLAITPLQTAGCLLLIAAACFGVFILLQKISHRLASCRLRTVPTTLAFGLVWMFTIAEQGLSMVTKRTEIWQKEHKLFAVHMGLFSPPPGLETIPVELVDPQTPEGTEALLAEAAELPELERRPDIFILMVESWRSDSISEEVTPFLYRFANTDCQDFEQTYAGSNCTPLSWFTLFHSRLALHWADTVKGAETPEGLPGAYPVRLLKQLGYQTSVRAVCDLEYKKLGDLNCGTGHKLADTFRDDTTLPESLGFPEREMIIVDDLKTQVRESQPGGHLHFIAFDSPHYNYYWPEKDFAPINEGCEGSISYTNINPSEEEILEVQKRYHNAVNWMDHQIEGFVNFLKEEG
ncbi:MAG: sulfatase-like hydrolase/transferase, partial [Verrucomicrobiales bacterium]